jgi:hypothetical protein
MASITMDVSEYDALKEVEKLLRAAKKESEELYAKLEQKDQEKILLLEKANNEKIKALEEAKMKVVKIIKTETTESFKILKPIPEIYSELHNILYTRNINRDNKDYVISNILDRCFTKTKNPSYIVSQTVNTHGLDEIKAELKLEIEQEYKDRITNIELQYSEINEKKELINALRKERDDYYNLFKNLMEDYTVKTKLYEDKIEKLKKVINELLPIATNVFKCLFTFNKYIKQLVNKTLKDI